MPLDKLIRNLSDRVEINELMSRYCRHADELDVENMLQCFTDDCNVSYVPPEAAEPARSKAELRGFLNKYFPNTISSSHYITNVELVFVDESTVLAHTYMYSWQRFKGYPSMADCHRFGRYEFRIKRSAEGWRFTHLRLMSMGEYGGDRIGEQFKRPWPPVFS